MRERTLRFILDSIFCMDAMSPEFKKANDILLRIVKMNDRTDGLPHTRLVEINKAFKENDAKAARAAFDKLKPLLAKGDKDLQDGLTEARSKLSEASQKAEQTKAAAVAAKGAVALFDKFRKAIDGVKAKPVSVSKLSAYADKLKAYGDFSKRIAQMSQMVAAKKDVSKQADMLAAACDKGKAKADEERAKAEKDYGAAKDRVSVFKEMEKIRSKKIAEFAKEKEDVQKLGAALPKSEQEKKQNSGNAVEGESEFQKRKKKLEQKINDIKDNMQKAINLVNGMKPEIEKFRRAIGELIKKNGINPDDSFWLSSEVERLHQKLADDVHQNIAKVYDLIPKHRMDNRFSYNSIPEKLYNDPGLFLNGFKRAIRKACNDMIRVAQRDIEKGPSEYYFL